MDEGDVFKKLINAIGDLVQDANFDCSDEGIRLQAMDSSHEDLLHHGEISGIEVKLINITITDLGSNQIQVDAELGISDSDAMLMKPIQFVVEL